MRAVKELAALMKPDAPEMKSNSMTESFLIFSLTTSTCSSFSPMRVHEARARLLEDESGDESGGGEGGNEGDAVV
jgi:hypothetical protein